MSVHSKLDELGNLEGRAQRHPASKVNCVRFGTGYGFLERETDRSIRKDLIIQK